MAKKTKQNINYTLPTKNIWFPDQVEPSIEDKEAFKRYWKREKHRCKHGFTLADGQVYISGWLYFHTVYWTIELDKEEINPVTGEKFSFKTKGISLLRDIEWMVAQDFQRAAREKKIYNLVSSRGIGKSFMAASFIGQAYTFYNDSESLITAGNNGDIAKLAEKINLGLSTIHPVFQKQRIKNNWKVEVRAGWVDSITGFEKGSNSRILSRNYDDGNNSMATNGTRPLRQVIDEEGKIPNLKQCVLHSFPSWRNDYGFFSLPFITGTGGDMEVGQDAGDIFNNPTLYNILEFDDIWEGKGKIGRFIPVTQGKNEYKHPKKLSEYLGIYHPDLERITILVSDEQECMEKYVLPAREKAMKSTSSNDIIIEKAYYPITPSECFLTVAANDFPVEACKAQLKWIQDNDIKPVNVELFWDLSNKVNHKFSDRLPIREWPVKPNSDKTGVVEVIEFPTTNPPFGTYVIGMDPYKTSESEYSDSVGSIYVFKRMVVGETYADMPIAWYHGRPSDINDWCEIGRMLAHYYNAQVMCENADEVFIQYMIARNEDYFLVKGQSILKEIAPNSKHKGEYGLPPTEAVIKRLNNQSVRFTKEVIVREKDEKGKPIKSILGVNKILDVMLLEEMIKYNKNKGNFDRIRAFGLACYYANQLDSSIPTVTLQETYQAQQTMKVIKSPFNLGMSTVTGHKSYRVKSPFMR